MKNNRSKILQKMRNSETCLTLRKVTDNAMAQRKRTKEQTMTYKTKD